MDFSSASAPNPLPPSPPLPPQVPSFRARSAQYLRAAGLVLRFRRVDWAALPRASVWEIALVVLLSGAMTLLMLWLVREPGLPWVVASDLLETATMPFLLLGVVYGLAGSSARPDEPGLRVSSVFHGLNVAGLLLMLPLVLLCVAFSFWVMPVGEAAELGGFWSDWVVLGGLGLATVLGLIWYLLALFYALRRLPNAGAGKAFIAVLLLALLPVAGTVLTYHDSDFEWNESLSEREAGDDEPAEPRGEALTPEALRTQFELLGEVLEGLPAQRPGVVDVYVLTYSPFDTPVFVRESETVVEVMQRRFDAGARVVELINVPELVTKVPWATPDNLERAIRAVAAKMDLAEDVLFIHFSSHGGEDGVLASQLLPLQMPELTAPEVRRMLDEAGVRWRLLSVSSCYSGSWIPPLASETALVMTAADAEHTSYGCGWRSELTYFTKAVFAEQLMTQTRSFAGAVTAASPVIKLREIEAGKDDGFSNPQLSVGAEMAAYLQRWEAALNRQR